jgi:hypothetical protein
MEKQKYYYIAIDKQAKTIQLRASQGDECQAVQLTKLYEDYGITENLYRSNRFALFFNGTKNYIDYSTFYKKYSKFTVLEAKI